MNTTYRVAFGAITCKNKSPLETWKRGKWKNDHQSGEILSSPVATKKQQIEVTLKSIIYDSPNLKI